jgi:FAD/FMN-containing dehydrogenase
MQAAKDTLKNAVSGAKIIDTPKILAKYTGDNSFVATMPPRQVVQVNSVDEVQQVIQWANRTHTPLIAVSSGAPHFKGDTIPGVPEAVVIDLSGMKKILGINTVHKMAYVEPGVTYAELQAALFEKGLTLSTCLAPRSTKSVLTSVMEVEPRLNPRHQWSYNDPLRCMQVVWGDGNKMLTGEASMGDPDIEKQWKSEKWQVGGGPGQFDFNRMLTGSQGTMGIVTWASLKCERLPQIHKLYFAASPKINPLLDMLYRILKLRFADELMIMSATYIASLMGKTSEEVKEIKNALPAWVALIGIAGQNILPAERVAAQEQDIAEIAQQFGLQTTLALPGLKSGDVLHTIINPSPEPYWKLREKGSFQDIFFITTLDKTPGFIATMYTLAEQFGYPTSDTGVYIQPQHAGTSCHCEFHLPYDPQNIKDTQKVRDLYIKASTEFSLQGAYYSRPYGMWSKLQYNKDAQTTVTLKKLKGIFDPNGVLNPGKLFNY